MHSTLKHQRPLSPHLQIYRVQITSLLSILHRGTGIALYGGTIVLCLWFLTLAHSPKAYKMLQNFMWHPLGLLLLMGWSYAFFYHLCNGIRHLMWDAGHGYDMISVRRSGWAVLISTTFLTGMSWVIGFLFWKVWP